MKNLIVSGILAMSSCTAIPVSANAADCVSLEVHQKAVGESSLEHRFSGIIDDKGIVILELYQAPNGSWVAVSIQTDIEVACILTGGPLGKFYGGKPNV